MPLAMNAVFRATTRRYGPERGYQAAFAIYWASCWALAGAVIGRRRLLELWRVPQQGLPPRGGLNAAVLVTPPLGGLATQWLPNARASGPAAVAAAVAVGTTNALAEEAFWRGVPVATFPDDPAARVAIAGPGVHRLAPGSSYEATVQPAAWECPAGGCCLHRSGLRVDCLDHPVPRCGWAGACADRRQRRTRGCSELVNWQFSKTRPTSVGPAHWHGRDGVWSGPHPDKSSCGRSTSYRRLTSVSVHWLLSLRRALGAAVAAARKTVE